MKGSILSAEHFPGKGIEIASATALSFEKFNHADWGNLERVGCSFLQFIIAL